MFDLAGKHVLVTGGTSGIGQAVALAFHEAGCIVTAAGLPARSSLPTGIETRLIDLTAQSAIDELFAGLPQLDVVVNSAGIIRRDEEFDIDVFERVIDVNLTSVMRACIAARQKFGSKGGCIVNIASLLSFFGAGRAPAYSASKGGIAQLTRSLAIAWAKENIRVNAVAPGWIETPLTEPLREDPERAGAILSRTPLARWGTAQEVASVVLFLCSGLASFMTGAIVPVDGGYSAF